MKKIIEKIRLLIFNDAISVSLAFVIVWTLCYPLWKTYIGG